MKKVLVIEDNRDVREDIADILELSNYKVVTAENGKTGIINAEKFVPDVIICDIMMPEMDGYEVLETLSRNEITAKIPFIFLSARAERADVRKGMNLGADDYITKPFEENELIEAIECRIKKKEFLTKQFLKNRESLHEFIEEASDLLNLKRVIQYHPAEKYQKRDIVFMEGDKVTKLYFIEKGIIKTSRITESGKEFVTGIYGTGDFVGQLSLISNRSNYTETATAIENAEVYGISKEDFNTLLYENKMVSKKFIDMISNNLVDVQEQLMNMAFAPVRQRVAKALLELYHKGFITDDRDSGVGIPREDFAGMIGTATETAIRMLTEFKGEGLITTGKGNKIILLKKDVLESISNAI